MHSEVKVRGRLALSQFFVVAEDPSRSSQPPHPQISETAYPIGHDTDRRVKEALGQSPSNDLALESQAIFRLIFDGSEAFQIFQNDRILKLQRPAGL